MALQQINYIMSNLQKVLCYIGYNLQKFSCYKIASLHEARQLLGRAPAASRPVQWAKSCGHVKGVKMTN